MRVGITGQTGFVGTHLYNTLALNKEIERIPFDDSYFNNADQLRKFVRACDVIVHLAAMNRHPDPQVIYDTNLSLAKQLVFAMEAENVAPYVFFSSSTQEELDNLYGKSKKEGRELFEDWAKQCGATFTGMIVPNVYGPFSRPYYNTFISTFAHQLINGDKPSVLIDTNVRLIYVGSLCNFIIEKIMTTYSNVVERVEIPYDFDKKVSDILSLFEEFRNQYVKNGYIPELIDKDEVNLFNTFRSHIDHSKHFPVKLVKNAGPKGIFVETIKLGVGGQVSFSTTVPGSTRGNHYHTRKIERFTVIKGKARIQLRRIGTIEVIDFYLNGNEPSYVDIPIWYTHNITNIGEEELFTLFWINEWYNPEDGDTYFEEV